MNCRSALAVLCSSIGLAALAFDADTLAFYTFNDQPSGTAADGCSVVNAVDASAYAGTCEKGKYGTFTFSDVRPATYVFAERGYKAQLLATNPGSLNMYATSNHPNENDDVGGTVRFADIAEELGGADEFTVEFYWRVHDGVTYWQSYGGMFILPVINKSSGEGDFIAASPTNEGFVRFRLNSASWKIVSYPGYNLQDGLWHHWAMVYKNGTMTCYGDRVYSNSAAMSFSAAKDAVMELGHKVLRGYVSCLRVTKRALTTDGFIYATECPTCLPADPRTVFHWSLDGAVGTSPSVLTNCVPDESPFVTNFFSLTKGRQGDGVVALDKVTGAGVTQVATAPGGRRHTLVDARDGSAVRENGGGDFLEVTGPTAAGGEVTGPYLSLPVGAFTPFNDSFTLECFMRFDRASWYAKSESPNKALNKYIALMGFLVGYSRPFGWRFHMIPPSRDGDYATFDISAYHKSYKLESTDKAYSKLFGSDSNWHHLAVTYDIAERKFTAICDYVHQIASLTMTEPMFDPDVTAASYFIGGGISQQPIEGCIDEVRLSRGVLTADEMIHLAKPPTGLMLIFR